MSHPIWIPEISSGIPALDKLHHDFFSALTELSLVDDREFCASYSRLVRKVEQIFRQEEEWMDQLDFPAFQEHQEQHARVLSALHHVFSRVMAGEVAVGRNVAENLLPQWLTFHMATMDMVLALSLQMSATGPARIPYSSLPVQAAMTAPA